MEDEEFREVIVTVIGSVVKHPDVAKLGGSGKIFSFGTIDADISWYIDATSDATFGEGMPERYDVRATMLKEDWLKTLQGKLSPTQAMLRRKITVDGSMMTIASLSMDALVQTYNEKIGQAS